MSTNPLKKEIEFYSQNKDHFLKIYKNQFLLIKEEELGGSFTTQEEAYKKGLEKYGNQPFLIKQVIENEVQISYPALMVGIINANFQ